MMGVWSTTLFGSGGMIQWQRWQGTLELGVGAPPPMTARLPAVLARERVHRDVRARRDAGLGPPRLRRAAPLRPPWLFALALPATVISLGLMGLAARVDVHPLPLRERALEPARVPGLDRVGARLLDVAPARPGRGRSRGCCRRTGACSRSATRRSAASVWVPLAMVLAARPGLPSRSRRSRSGMFEHLARARATLSLT